MKEKEILIENLNEYDNMNGEQQEQNEKSSDIDQINNIENIKNDNLKLISIKENAHDNMIYTLSKLGIGLILSGSGDNSIKIW